MEKTKKETPNKDKATGKKSKTTSLMQFPQARGMEVKERTSPLNMASY